MKANATAAIEDIMGTKQEQRFPFEPDYAVPPGRTLQETIDHLGIDLNELAARTGLTEQEIDGLISGDARLTADTAMRLEQVTGLPSQIWNNLEAIYRKQLARLESREQRTSRRE